MNSLYRKRVQSQKLTVSSPSIEFVEMLPNIFSYTSHQPD